VTPAERAGQAAKIHERTGRLPGVPWSSFIATVASAFIFYTSSQVVPGAAPGINFLCHLLALTPFLMLIGLIILSFISEDVVGSFLKDFGIAHREESRNHIDHTAILADYQSFFFCFHRT
jgi:hypothetical protein